ncbi:MAG: PilT/PilU family type 4a pilus ATPase [Deltaproteobacteria bacterium]|nr:PilT/PilU family type 4a pilus ATPase [Deltaproteobacteria bacterium]
MSELLPDPDLDELVQVLNRSSAGSKTELQPSPQDLPRENLPLEEIAPNEALRGVLAPQGEAGLDVQRGNSASASLLPEQSTAVQAGLLEPLFQDLAETGASDLLLVPGEPPVLRLHGHLRRSQRPTLTPEDMTALFEPYLGGYRKQKLEQRGSVDFSLTWEAARFGAGGASDSGKTTRRFRINLHRQRGSLAAAVRALPSEIPSLESLNLPNSLASWGTTAQGLVLLCGATGSGKSSTLAALVAEINRTRACHIVTIEDPVEYVHPPGKSVVEQLEVGRDTPSFAEALRSTLRQDPDVILVGEMRDLETISAVLTAAETGHLVFSTLHSGDSTRAIYRMVDVFPAQQQAQVRHQLSQALSAIVVQHLIPRIGGGGRVPAVEILRATYPVRHHIRRQQFEKLYNEIHLGQRQGMRTLEASLASLVSAGAIHVDEARLRANHPEELETLLGV